MGLARLGPSVKLWSTCYNIISFSFIQSAYRKLHSTETVLIRVHSDIAIALDQKRSVILLLLDLSAAFDTVDHCILLLRISLRFGIGGTATYLKPVTTLQKRVVRIMTFSDPRSHSELLLKSVRLLKFSDINHLVTKEV